MHENEKRVREMASVDAFKIPTNAAIRLMNRSVQHLTKAQQHYKAGHLLEAKSQLTEAQLLLLKIRDFEAVAGDHINRVIGVIAQGLEQEAARGFTTPTEGKPDDA